MDLQIILKIIENETCEIHNEHPKNVKIVNDSIVFECCCDNFRKKLVDILNDEVDNQMLEEIDSIFKT